MAQPQPQPRRRRRRLGLARAAKDAKLAARFVTPARFVRRRRRSAASVLPSPPPLRAALRVGGWGGRAGARARVCVCAGCALTPFVAPSDAPRQRKCV
jgi:hypothetical protein